MRTLATKIRGARPRGSAVMSTDRTVDDHPALRRLYSRVLEILRNRPGKVRECHLGLLDFRVPLLLPLETVVPLVSGARKDLDLRLHRHLAGARQHVAPAGARGRRILEVRVADPAAERGIGLCGRLVAVNEGVMRVP